MKTIAIVTTIFFPATFTAVSQENQFLISRERYNILLSQNCADFYEHELL